MALAIRQIRDELSFHPQGRSLTDITPEIVTWLNGIGAREGLLTIFLKHTSASLAIQENTDPDVQRDILDALDRLAPEGAGYRHRCEGADDMPAHIKAMLTPVSLSIPVVEGALALGTWQAVYLLEHRRQKHRRTVVVHFLGAAGSQHH
ncbi:MAG: secondary thiamine-phosphate synthase enzyme YjbQ [Hyphomicrobiaceae bacterium]